MQLSTLDRLKKALLDTQEQVRDFKNYANDIQDEEIKEFFQSCAETEGIQAAKLQKFIEENQA
ncbi:MAG: hypothetical protein CVU84_10980 [Firmicutes bacterium HGW-Firmicutes-1]|jgi:rubrerythrin|nr:MAG: hypothetical protein CVU84_10980 [Firmicutes bacterium HGW-Firmicutes-1]